jgi:hypothetical protein
MDQGDHPMMPNRRKVTGNVSAQSYAVLESMIASHRVENVGEAVDLAIAALQRENRRKNNGHAAPYTAEPSAEEVAQDRATVRAMHDSNPDLLFDD